MDNKMKTEKEIAGQDGSGKKVEAQKARNSMSRRRLRSGAYSTVLAVVVIAIVLLLNLFVSELDLNLDLTAENRYTLTDDTVGVLEGLKDEITIYFLAQEESQDNAKTIVEKILNQYGDFPKVNVEVRDPVIYPQFAAEYTDAEIQSNDVIVVNEGNERSQYISTDEIYLREMDYATYSESVSLDAEGQLTAAIQNVSSENATKMYALSDHNEIPIGAEFGKFLKKANVQTETLSTMAAESGPVETIPEDCDVLLVNGPEHDLMEQETTMIREYLDNGGKAIFTLRYTQNELTNYKSLINYYGVDVVDGVVCETEGKYYRAPYEIVNPSMNQEHEIMQGLPADKFLLIPQPKGLLMAQGQRGSLTVEDLIATSDEAYSKVNMSSTVIEEEEGDVSGPLHLAIAATDLFKDFETKVVVFGGGLMFSEDFFTTGQFNNGEIFLKATQWLTGNKGSTLVVPPRGLAETYLTIPAPTRRNLSIVTIAIIPIGMLLLGFGIWYVRRRS